MDSGYVVMLSDGEADAARMGGKGAALHGSVAGETISSDCLGLDRFGGPGSAL